MHGHGKREFYTPAMAKRMGLESQHERCLTCPEKDKCAFYLDLAADKNSRSCTSTTRSTTAISATSASSGPDINIEDTMNVLVKYDNGVTLTYSLNAFNAWEGYTIAFNGTKGRLEHQIVEGGAVSAGATNYQGRSDRERTRVIPLRGAAQEIEPGPARAATAAATTSCSRRVRHGRARQVHARRRRTQRPVFVPDRRVGEQELRDRGAVKVADLVTGLNSPMVAPMPTRNDPVPMPVKA